MKPSTFDTCLKMFSRVCAGLLVFSIAAVITFLAYKGLRAINLSLIFGNTPVLDALLLKRQVFDGLLPAIAGTIFLVILSMSFALPAGLLTGIFMAEYCPYQLKWFFSLMFDILAGIPSIVVGLAGFCITIFAHKIFGSRIFPCLFISALSLAFLVLPYIIRTTQLSLENLPPAVRLTAPSLGATKLQNIFFVLLPTGFSNILSGIILAVGRCAEDTAVIMLTGAVAMAGIPKSIFSGYEALPFYIYYISSQYSNAAELSRGYGACLILLFICVNLFILAHMINKKLSTKMLYRP